MFSEERIPQVCNMFGIWPVKNALVNTCIYAAFDSKLEEMLRVFRGSLIFCCCIEWIIELSEENYMFVNANCVITHLYDYLPSIQKNSFEQYGFLEYINY